MPKASELINRSNTICHYKRFSEFSEPNCNGCNDGDSKMVELLHLFAENRLTPRSDKTPEVSTWGHDTRKPNHPYCHPFISSRAARFGTPPNSFAKPVPKPELQPQ